MVDNQLFRIAYRNILGHLVGITASCTAHPFLIESILIDGLSYSAPVLIEATCNQVNQDGGYTGQRPDDFVLQARSIAARVGLPLDHLILGGDHLGPNPWRKLPVDEAMARGRRLVSDYVKAGFEKIHLDASMPLGGDPPKLETDTVAERAAELCVAAENAADGRRPCYVIGTEVPVPGGESGGLGGIRVTSAASLEETVDSHRRAFKRRGLESAFERVLAVVAQPGVDFDQTSILPFDKAGSQQIRPAIEALGGLVGEAHSTDYQSAAALKGLVASHFAVLKVGPELTYAYRSAILSLAEIEKRVIPRERQSDIEGILIATMTTKPDHWVEYYQGDGSDLRNLQLFSFSDRIRYYWPEQPVGTALRSLLENLHAAKVGETLWREAFPDLDHDTPRTPSTAMRGRIVRVLDRYRDATGG